MSREQLAAELTSIEKMIAQGDDPWEAIVSSGLASEDDITERRWHQGDLAGLVEKRYRDDRLGSFAKAINTPVSTIKQRREMSAFYKKDTRYLFANLGYTHYRDAKRLGDVDKALWALEKASIRGWTTERMGMIISRYLKGYKPNAPAKLADTEIPIYAIRGNMVTFAFSPEVVIRLIDQWRAKRRVRVAIHEVKVDESVQPESEAVA